MSCFPELTYAIYVDGELPPDEARPLEAHLVGCRRCRELVVALREEAELVTDVLQERIRQAQHAAARPAPARGIALGFGPALAVAAAVTLALGWVLDAVRAASVDQLTPFSIRGVADMAFDLIFLLRDEAPAAFEVALAVAAMASTSALLCFALTAVLRRASGPGPLMLAALLALVGPAAPSQAHFGLHKGPDYTLPAGETHDGTLVATGGNVNIDGVVTGDLFAFSKRLTVRGEVRGNVVAIARNIELPGDVQGSVHLAGGRTNVSGEVRDNLYTAGEYVSVGGSASVGRDAAMLAESGILEGSVGRDLLAGGRTIELRGSVGRNLGAWAKRLALLDGARVQGDIDAVLPPETQVEIAPGAFVAGETRTRVRVRHHERGLSRFLEPRFYVWLVLQIAAGFAVGMLLRALVPGVFSGRLETAGAFFRSMGVGFLAVVATPVALALIALTVVGIPLALLGVELYLTSLFLSGILVAALIGSVLVQPRGEGWSAFGLTLLAGLAILVVASHLPFLGGLVRAIAVLAGMGLLVNRAHAAWASLHRVPA
jgi:cytoskeletal protein CcmA (bactofilin family)/anti-sigma factor RsiW